jgi:hypothetical protein
MLRMKDKFKFAYRLFLMIIFYSRVCVRGKRPIQRVNNVRSQVDQPIM